jgi:hypothetical protein
MEKASIGQRFEQRFARAPFDAPQPLRLLERQAQPRHFQVLGPNAQREELDTTLLDGDGDT